MNWRTATKVTVLAIVAVAFVYDVIAYAAGGVDATISRVTLKWASDIPIVALGVGVVVGHLWWPQPCRHCADREAHS